MQASRGETIQKEGYLGGSRQQEQELRSYQQPNKEPQSLGKYYEARQEGPPQEMVKQEEESWAGYFLHWGLVIIAFGLYVAVWAINFKQVGYQASTYYHNSYSVNQYVDAQANTYAASTLMFSVDTEDAKGFAMAILYSWILWKFPLVVWVLHLTHNQ